MEFSFVPKSKYFCENGNLDCLHSKSFARILDHKLSQFIGTIDWQSQSLNMIAYFDGHEENFWRGYQLQTQRNSSVVKKIIGEVIHHVTKCIVDCEKN